MLLAFDNLKGKENMCLGAYWRDSKRSYVLQNPAHKYKTIEALNEKRCRLPQSELICRS